MDCPDCDGEGTWIRKACTVDGIKYPKAVVACFRCDGDGELCDVCGESMSVCNGHDDEGGDDE